jgi:hypothetical protein
MERGEDPLDLGSLLLAVAGGHLDHEPLAIDVEDPYLRCSGGSRRKPRSNASRVATPTAAARDAIEAEAAAIARHRAATTAEVTFAG